jgi:hypothetical protein
MLTDEQIKEEFRLADIKIKDIKSVRKAIDDLICLHISIGTNIDEKDALNKLIFILQERLDTKK